MCIILNLFCYLIFDFKLVVLRDRGHAFSLMRLQ